MQRGPLAAELRRVLRMVEEDPAAIPEPTPPGPAAPLTVGVATYDDFDGAWFTVESLVLHHAPAMRGAEILLLDNHPEGPAAPVLKGLDAKVPGLRYLPVTTVRSTAVRDLIFRHARGEVVVVLDSHVLLAPGALEAVAAYFQARPGCRDLVQGPMLNQDAQGVHGTHLEPGWSCGMYGTWATDPRGLDPAGDAFDIPMQGLGAFACRRDAWPGLHPKFRSFGGEEGYVHEKIRRAGGRTVCLPAMRWLHRFDRPAGVPYPYGWLDRLRNNVLAWSELGWDVDEVYDHYRRFLSGPEFREAVAPTAVDDYRVRIEAELAHPASAFDGVLHRGAALTTAQRTAAVPITGLPEVAGGDPAAVRLLAHRLCLDFARLHGWRDALVLEPGAALPGLPHDPGADITVFTAPDGAVRAVAYGPHALDTLLPVLPRTGPEAEPWVRDGRGIETWPGHPPTGLTVTSRTLDAFHEPAYSAARRTLDADPDHPGTAMPDPGTTADGRPADTAPRRGDALDTHDVADGIVVYRAADATVHHLNAVAAAVFELSDGRSGDGVAAELADIFALTPRQAHDAVQAAWHELTGRALLV